MSTNELRQFGQITAFKRAEGLPIAFHAEKMESAVISNELWQAMAVGLSDTALNPFQDLLKNWSEEAPALIPPVSKTHQVVSLSINVTQVCNLHCVYCAAGGDGTYGDPIKRISVEKTLPQIKYFIEKAQNSKVFKITYIGGEPLLYADALQMIHDYAQVLCAQAGIELQEVVVTNGTQFNENNLQILGSVKPAITVSLDGDSEINDRLRPTASGRGVTHLVKEGLSRLAEARRQGLPIRSVGVSGVFGRRNENLLKAYEFYKDLDVDWFDFTYDHLETESEINQNYIEQMKTLMKVAFLEAGEVGLRKIKLIDNYFEMLDNQVPTRNFCGAGKSLLVIDGRNHLYACPWLSGQSKERVGSGTQIFAEKLKEYQSDLVDMHGCQNCWARSLCGGGCMFIHEKMTGNRHQVDPNFCTRTQSLIAESLLYYEQCRKA